MPKNTAAIPNNGGSACGFQVWVVKMFPVFSVNAGIAFQIRKIAIAAMITSSSPPDPAARRLEDPVAHPDRAAGDAALRRPAVRGQPTGRADVLGVGLQVTDRQRTGHAQRGDLEPFVS